MIIVIGSRMRLWVTLALVDLQTAPESKSMFRFSVYLQSCYKLQLEINFSWNLFSNSLKNGIVCKQASIRPSNKPMGVFVFARPPATLNLIKLGES